MRKVLCTIIASIMLVTMLSGCSLLQKMGFGDDEDELQPVSSLVMNEEEAKKLTDKMPISLYFATEDSSKLKLEVRYIDVSEGKKSVNHLAGIIVNELIAGPKDEGLRATIPQGTKLLGSIGIDAKVATVNLSKELVDNHTGDEAAARMTIYSIVNSLTENNDIEKVKFLVDGKPKADFKGAYKFDSTFPRTVSLISNDVGNAAAAAKVKDNAKQGTQDKSKSEKEGQQGNTKSSPAPSPTATPKPTSSAAPKLATPSPKAPTVKDPNNSQSSNIASEDAEATYLEVLE